MPSDRPQTDFRQPPRLVARFAVYAGLAVVLAALGALLLARFNAGSETDHDLAEDAAYIADELGRDDLARTAFVGRVTADEEAQLDELLGRVAAARAVERASLVSPEGAVSYSTDHGLIGRPERALSGDMLSARAPVRWLLDATRTRGTLVVQRAAAAVAEDVNEKACELLGYHQDELLGKHAMELMSIGDVAKLPLHMAELASGRTLLVERPVRRKDGTFLIGDISAKKLEDGRVLASIRDVTERKRLEHELHEAHKVESVGRFAGGIAHDFSELLNSIAKHADALARRVGADPDVEGIRNATHWGGSLTSQLLTVGTKQTQHPQALDLNDTLARVHKELVAIAGDRVELHVRPGEAIDRVSADPDQLEKVIVDLVLHARDGMPRGGTLAIETGNVDFSQNGRSRRKAGGRHVMLSISDTGRRRDDTSRPFGNQEEDGGERLGLGLAAVYGVVQQNGGSIGVESEPGVGTTVRIYLPSADVPAELDAPLGRTQSA